MMRGFGGWIFHSLFMQTTSMTPARAIARRINEEGSGIKTGVQPVPGVRGPGPYVTPALQFELKEPQALTLPETKIRSWPDPSEDPPDPQSTPGPLPRMPLQAMMLPSA